MRQRIALAVAAVLGASLVAVPAGAARLINSADIADGAIRSIDIQNGAITSQDIANRTITNDDLARGLLASRVTGYAVDSSAGPDFDDTFAMTGDRSVTIATRRSGKILFVASRPATATFNSLDGYTADVAFYLDDDFIAGTSVEVTGVDGCSVLPVSCFGATATVGLGGLVIANVPAGTHRIRFRYATGGAPLSLAVADVPAFAVVELG